MLTRARANSEFAVSVGSRRSSVRQLVLVLEASALRPSGCLNLGTQQNNPRVSSTWGPPKNGEDFFFFVFVTHHKQVGTFTQASRKLPEGHWISRPKGSCELPWNRLGDSKGHPKRELRAKPQPRVPSKNQRAMARHG